MSGPVICPIQLYAPIHLAVREGHTALVEYLLNEGALDPSYRIYPFLDSLLTIAQDREHHAIVRLLEQYLSNPSLCQFTGDTGGTLYNRTPTETAFEQAVNKDDLEQVEKLLDVHPSFALDDTFFWSEGILMMPAKVANYRMVELLMRYGARVPPILKWAQFYYFERYESAVFMMEHGMNPHVMSWHHVTLLHDMAQKGFLDKAALLIKYGAKIDLVDEEYRSTPLGMAARWGREDMVDYLLQQGADPNQSGAPWATPLAWAKKKGYTNIESKLRRAGALH